MKRLAKPALFTFVGLFAVIGLVFSGVFVAMQFGAFNVPGSIAQRNSFFLSSTTPSVPAQPCVDTAKSVCAWNESPEWAVVAGGLQKDAGIIARVSQETGIPARLIATVVIPEQLRFFTSEREVFKRYFEPLKILGSLSQFSLGVSGLKQDTAAQVEVYANDPTSAFYPGEEAQALIAYNDATTTPRDAQLFARLTNEKNHYYSYLYTALYIKEIQAQWAQAGFPIADKADIVATLFNIGFEKSNPNANPQPAGAGITVGGRTYPFGVLGGLFYASGELTDVFPR